jgi:hypothetical protein
MAADEFAERTQAAVVSLSTALLEQLDPATDAGWTAVEFRARNAVTPEILAEALGAPGSEGVRMTLTLTINGEQHLRIPRAGVVRACHDLGQVATHANMPAWRAVRLVLTREPDGEPRYQCWWEYDNPA